MSDINICVSTNTTICDDIDQMNLKKYNIDSKHDDGSPKHINKYVESIRQIKDINDITRPNDKINQNIYKKKNHNHSLLVKRNLE